jgi:SMI1 / KNR4 family (SUKH-1)
MIIESAVKELKNAAGCRFYHPLPEDVLDTWEVQLGLSFPDTYRKFLATTNGCEAYYGFFRIFGFDPTRSIDAVRWNEADCWKFAWDGRPDGYWCFGETVFGDQYSFSYADLRDRRAAPVYMLHHTSMSTESPWSCCFTDFLEKEFLRNARAPYSRQEARAFQLLGPIDLANHAVMVPPLLFLPVDDDGLHTELQIMPASAAMICNGDLGVQWDAGCHEGRRVERVEPYVDDQQRMRLRILWEDGEH